MKLAPTDVLPQDFSFSVGSFRLRGSRAAKEKISDDIKGLGGRGHEWGSIAVSVCAVARGEMGAFIQGSSKEHDVVAALFIAQQAGAPIYRGSSQVNGQVDVVASHPTLFYQVRSSFLKHAGRTRVRDG